MTDDEKFAGFFEAEIEPLWAEYSNNSSRWRKEGRGLPIGELLHVAGGHIGNMPTPDRTNPTSSIPLFLAQTAPVLERLESWEAQCDFNALQWQGLKPSEFIQTVTEKLKSFYANRSQGLSEGRTV